MNQLSSNYVGKTFTKSFLVSGTNILLWQSAKNWLSPIWVYANWKSCCVKWT